jgi:hypothetical protein
MRIGFAFLLSILAARVVSAIRLHYRSKMIKAVMLDLHDKAARPHEVTFVTGKGEG